MSKSYAALLRMRRGIERSTNKAEILAAP